MEGKWYYKFINPNRSIKEIKKKKKKLEDWIWVVENQPGELNGKKPTDREPGQ